MREFKINEELSDFSLVELFFSLEITINSKLNEKGDFTEVCSNLKLGVVLLLVLALDQVYKY